MTLREELFWWLVKRHCTVNLQMSLPYLKDGRLHDSKYPQGKPIQNGSDNSVPYQGFLVVVHNGTPVKRLKDLDIILDEQLSPSIPINSEESFQHCLEQQMGDDGSYMFGYNRELTPVAEINNNPSLPLGFSLYNKIPEYFFSSNSLPSSPQKLGTKTRLAIKLPYAQLPDAERIATLQLKRSVRDGLPGLVTSFDDLGLRMFSFEMDLSNKGPFLAPGIIGIYSEYAKSENNRPVEVMRRMVERSEVGY